MPGCPPVEACRLVKGLPKKVEELLGVPRGQWELVSHGSRLTTVFQIGLEGAQGVVPPPPGLTR